MAKNYNSNISYVREALESKESRLLRQDAYDRHAAKTFELPEADFFQELGNCRIKLKDRQKEDLSKRYTIGSGSRAKIKYDAFFNDLRKCMEESVAPTGAALSREQ